MFKCVIQCCDGSVCITMLVEQGNELRADDCASGIGLGTLQGLVVADAKAYHARISEVHGIDATEILLLGLVEVGLSTGNACRADHIYETIGMLVNEPYALLAGLWGNHHNHPDVIAVGNGLHIVKIVPEGQVGNDDSAHAAVYATSEKVVYTIVHDDVQIAHQYERDGYHWPDIPKLLEYVLQRDAIAQGCGTCTLNDRAVGERVAEGYSHLYHVYTPALQRQYHVGSTVKGWTACTEIYREQLAVATL